MRVSTVHESGIEAVSSAIIHVNDLAGMVKWYGELLDMPTKELDAATPYYVFDMDNGVNVMLDDHRSMTDQAKHPICMFKTLDIEKSYAWAKETGIPIVLEMQHVHPGLSYFNILDSEDNVLMIIYSDWVNPKPIAPRHADNPIQNNVKSIVVPVIDLKRATEWYAKLLGHAIKPERQNGGPIYWFDMDNGTGILLDDNRQHAGKFKYPTLMLKASDIQEAYRYMEAKNVRIVIEIEHDNHFFAQDPEGNTIIICK